MSPAPPEIFPEAVALADSGSIGGGVAARFLATIGEKTALYWPVRCFVSVRQDGKKWLTYFKKIMLMMTSMLNAMRYKKRDILVFIFSPIDSLLHA